MNWHMIISGLIVVVLKIVGMTLFLLYFPQIFGENNIIFIPTESSGTVPQILGNGTVSFTPTESYGTVCPKGWDFHQGRCFFLSKSELSWNKSMNFCKEKGSTLAIVNTPEKLETDKSCGFSPWIGKIPWRRKWQPTPVFLLGESPWTEEPEISPGHNWC
ncbi:C-type lectin domain family 5 member A isoform X3 [Ovis aries]|uniref:C-type lectin domain family 5 member A isoform X3 n=1 Tax=Ovis aries TaxID=9940 RepID=UPI001C2E4F10|nr:C-type lectin domain family 5 member A isoform X3 [Ovis aries]